MMTTHDERDGGGSTERRPTELGRSHPASGRSEELHLRNFDVRRAYDVTVELRDEQGLAFATRYYLTPGKAVSETDRLPAGEYEVRVELDGRRSRTIRCEIDETPEGTVLIEVGNGTVSVTGGLYQ